LRRLSLGGRGRKKDLNLFYNLFLFVLFEWLFLNAKLECSLSLSPQITKYLQQGIQRSKFTTIYSASQAIFALIDSGKLGEEDIDFATTNEMLVSLLDDKALMRETTKENSGSAYKTGLALELISSLHQRFPVSF
jgi:hypothetical protein